MANHDTIEQSVKRMESHSYPKLWRSSKTLLFARFFSDLLNPIFVPVFFFGIGLKIGGFGAIPYFKNMGIAVLFFTVIPFMIILYFLSTLHIKTLDLPDRSSRKKPFLYAIGSYLIGILFLAWVTSPHNLAIFFALCFFINALVGALITLRWKISIHTAGIACMIAAFIFMDQHHLVTDPSILKSSMIWSSLLLIPIMIWARLKLDLHTFNENLSGAVFGLVLTYIELMIFVH